MTPRTVEELQEVLQSTRDVLREPQVAHEEWLLDGVTVFRSLPEAACETYVLVRGTRLDQRVWPDEAAAVAGVLARIHGGDDDPGRLREPPSVAPRTVEELRLVMAELGQDPDDVGRKEDRNASRADGAVLFARCDDGTVRLITCGRGTERPGEVHSDEASAVLDFYRRHVLSRPRRPVTDLTVATMRAHLHLESAPWSSPSSSSRWRWLSAWWRR